MLYLQNTDEAQVLIVPKNCTIPPGDLFFVAKSTIDLSTEINIQVANLDISDTYMHLSVIVPSGCPNGEYEYSVQVGSEIISTGLLIIGENTNPDQYEKPISYEQYKTE